MPLVEKKPDAAQPPPKPGASGGDAQMAKQSRVPPRPVKRPPRADKPADGWSSVFLS